MARNPSSDIGKLLLSERSPTTAPVQAYRARVNFGLRTRPLGVYTFELTAGSNDAANTYQLTDASGTGLVATPVQATGTTTTDATSFATAVNSNYAAHGWWATVSSSTVTLTQRKSGADALTKVVTGDAAGTLSSTTATTDTWTEFVSGATFDGDLYYELSWSGALLAIKDVDTDNARAIDLNCYCDGQGVTFWTGGLRTASNAIVQGIPLATATWYHATHGDYLPIADSEIPVIIKLAADEELLYSVGII